MKWKVPVPAFETPDSFIFAHATRMADAWTARPEVIVATAYRVDPAEIVVEVADRSTAELGYRRLTRNPIRRMKRLRTIDMSGQYVFDARYECDSNMGHYVTDTVAKILVARQRLSERFGEDVVIHTVLRDRPLPMATEVFETLGLPTITTEANVVGRVVSVTGGSPQSWYQDRIVPGVGPVAFGLLPELYADVRERLQSGATGLDKIFISRKCARTIENEREITDLLAARGFQKVYFETGEMPVLEQWRTIAQAREIVAIHGAGLTPMVFNPHGLARPTGDLGGLRIVEIFGAGYFVDFNRRLAAVMNARWRGVRGQITPEIIRDMDFRGGGRVHQASSFRIDPQTIEMALDESADNYSPLLV